MDSKKILIASAIFNVILVISLSCLAVHYTGNYYSLHKEISEQNETISGQKNKLAEQNKTIVKIQSLKVNQSKKIDDLKNQLLGKLFFLGYCKFIKQNLLFLAKSRNCKDIYDFDRSLPTGTYKIEVYGEIFEVWCEMNSSSGGWTVSLSTNIWFFKYK